MDTLISLDAEPTKVLTRGPVEQAAAAAAAAQDSIALFAESSADVEVFVEGRGVKVHSVVLGMASPVFAALFLNRMKEGLTKQLTLEGKSREEFELFISFLYPTRNRVPRAVDEQSVDVLLRWADEYQIDGLKYECETLLMSLPCSIPRVLQAQRYSLERQYARCLEELSDESIVAGLELLADDPEVLRDLLPKLGQRSQDRKEVCIKIEKLISAPNCRSSLKDCLPFVACSLRLACEKQSLRDAIRGLKNITPTHVTGLGPMIQKPMLNARVDELEVVGNGSRSI